MKKITLPLIMVFAFMLLVGGGCSLSSDKEETSEEAVTEVTEYDSNWTSTINKTGIATTEVAGTINEQEATIADVQIKKWDDEYSWSFSNMASDETCGLVMDNNAVNFRSTRLETGTFEKKMEDEIDFDNYHAYYQYEQSDGTPMSVNVSWSAKIVVEEIDTENNKVKGYAKVDFGDGKTMIDGSFEADLCE